MGCWQAGAFFIVSVGAWYLLRDRHHFVARTSIAVGLAIAMVASLGQLVSGHGSAVTIAEHQPAKLAAFEGVYETGADADLTILGWVDEENRTVHGIRVPGLLSVLIGGSRDTVVKGLNDIPVDDRPPVQLTFQLYHLMVAVGMTLIALSWGGGLLAWRGVLYRSRTLLWVMVLAVLLPQLANQLGWAAAEIGRQPWIVYGLMRTAEAVSPTVAPGQVLLSLILFTVIYLALFVVFFVLLDQKIKQGPHGTEPHGAAGDREVA
jgi:cytochrome d ubiquinol oxidase subunit I